MAPAIFYLIAFAVGFLAPSFSQNGFATAAQVKQAEQAKQICMNAFETMIISDDKIKYVIEPKGIEKITELPITFALTEEILCKGMQECDYLNPVIADGVMSCLTSLGFSEAELARFLENANAYTIELHTRKGVNAGKKQCIKEPCPDE